MVQRLHELGIKVGIITNGHFGVRFSPLSNVGQVEFNRFNNLLVVHLNYPSKASIVLRAAGPKDQAESNQGWPTFWHYACGWRWARFPKCLLRCFNLLFCILIINGSHINDILNWPARMCRGAKSEATQGYILEGMQARRMQSWRDDDGWWQPENWHTGIS